MLVIATIVAGLMALSLGTLGLAALDATYNLRDRKFLSYTLRGEHLLAYLSSLPTHKKASLAALLGLSSFIVLGLLLKAL